jgi:hypothetical protein
VDLKTIDLRGEVRQLLEPRLETAPVELQAPVVDKRAHEVKRRSPLPVFVVDLVPPAHRGQTPLKIVEPILRDGDAVRADGLIGHGLQTIWARDSVTVSAVGASPLPSGRRVPIEAAARIARRTNPAAARNALWKPRVNAWFTG